MMSLFSKINSWRDGSSFKAVFAEVFKIENILKKSIPKGIFSSAERNVPRCKSPIPSKGSRIAPVFKS